MADSEQEQQRRLRNFRACARRALTQKQYRQAIAWCDDFEDYCDQDGHYWPDWWQDMARIAVDARFLLAVEKEVERRGW
jgi:hypothetical protein